VSRAGEAARLGHPPASISRTVRTVHTCCIYDVRIMDATTTATGPARAAAGKVPPAAERVYAYVKKGVLDRSYEGGTLLTEGDLAGAVGVSRTPVREALLRLEAEGLLKLYPKKGALVLPVSAQEITDVVETRLLVEQHAVLRLLGATPPGPAFPGGVPGPLPGEVPDRLRGEVPGTASGEVPGGVPGGAAPLAVPGNAALPPGLIARLEASLAEQREHAAAGDLSAFAAADRGFHAEIVRAAGNRILAQLYDKLRDRQLRMGVAIMNAQPSRVARSIVEHTEILGALRGGDASAAAEVVGRHVSRVATLVRARS
jgi:DNA-binding GntR family transcriptional regulator